MISDRQLAHKIKEAFRNSPESSAYSKEACEARRVAFLNQIGAEDTSRPIHTFKDYLQYYSWNFTHGFLLPAAAGFAMVLFVIGGWVTTAAAAQDALPGDPLYGVKISTEKLQLSLILNAEKRAQLHMAFASRRLNEMEALNAQQASEGKTERLQVAVNGFTSQVSSATSTLQSLPEHSQEAIAVARQMETKAQQYKGQVNETPQAAQAVEEASDVAVEVMMTNAEQSAQDSAAVLELRAAFGERQEALDTAVKFMLGRIAVLREVRATIELDHQTSAVLAVSAALKEAEGLMGTGAFRTAFELLDAAEADLAVVDSALIDLETPPQIEEAPDVKGTQE